MASAHRDREISRQETTSPGTPHRSSEVGLPRQARRQAFHLPDLGFHRAVDELIAALESVSRHAKTVGPAMVVAKRSGQPRTPDANTLRVHLPDSKIRRLFLLYRPPKVYGWLLRIYFIVACVSAPVFLLTSVLLRSAKVSGDSDADGFLGSAVFATILALGLRFLTVRLERKFLPSKPT